MFVNGCFWHQHDDSTCPCSHVPLSRQDYWLPKLEKTVRRDEENLRKLRQEGWAVLVLWECQAKDAAFIVQEAIGFLGPPHLTR